MIPFLKRNQVTTPPAGYFTLFYDQDNGNVLTYKDSDCNYVAVGSFPADSVDTTKIDDCLCEIVSDMTCKLSESASKGVITMTELQSFMDNLGMFSNVTVDPSTGSTNHGITSTPVLFVQLTTTDVLCNGDATGTASATVTGGKAPYTLDWKDSAGAAANPATLAADSYTLTVTDNVGVTKVITFIITEPAALALVVNVQNESAPAAADGIASAVVSGGVSPYTYVWKDNLGTPIGQTTQTATGLTAGTYQVTVTDANGCIIEELNVVVA